MKTSPAKPTSIDQYIAGFAPQVQSILKKIRQVVRTAAPEAEETISYQMPAFRHNGILVYFAAFKNHIGLYPPVRGNRAMEKAISPYRGKKGNLQFPLDEPIPYGLIDKIVRLRVKQSQSKASKTA